MIGKYLELIPAHCRDYRNGEDVETAFLTGVEFRDTKTCQYTTKAELIAYGYTTVNLRYKNGTMTKTVKI